VATVLGELAQDERLDARAIADTARHFPLATARGLGYLLDLLDPRELAAELNSLVERRRGVPADLLAPHGRYDGDVDPRWRARVNTGVERDL
jgi:hypothetical protein